MRYRKQTADGDYIMGQVDQFHVNTPEGVAQAVKTRLGLATGEWFLDTNEGTDYAGSVLGYGTQGTRDFEILGRILGTEGVLGVTSYSSEVVDRQFRVNAVIDTVYGAAQVTI